MHWIDYSEMSWDPSIPILSGELGSCGLHPMSAVSRPCSSYSPLTVMVTHQTIPALHTLWYRDVSKCKFLLRNKRCHIPEALGIQGGAGFSWFKEVTKWLSFDLHYSIHSSYSRTLYQKLDCYSWRSGLPMSLYLHSRSHCKKCGLVCWGNRSVSKELALHIQSPEPTLNKNNQKQVWWYALLSQCWRDGGNWISENNSPSQVVSQWETLSAKRWVESWEEYLRLSSGIQIHVQTYTQTQKENKKEKREKKKRNTTLCPFVF